MKIPKRASIIAGVHGPGGNAVVARASASWRIDEADRMTKRYHTAMTRSDLIATIAHRFPTLVAKDTEVAVKVILDALCDVLVQGGRIEIRGFGSFSLNYRPARTGRNPKSGLAVPVASKYVPHFKAGKELRDRIAESAQLADLCAAGTGMGTNRA